MTRLQPSCGFTSMPQADWRQLDPRCPNGSPV